MLKMSILFILFLGVSYLIYGVARTYKINVWQNKVGETLPDTFKIELPVIKNQDNYFCIKASINDNDETDFIIDTQASSLAKIETIDDLTANYWGKYPAPVSNFYGQKERLSLYFFERFKIQSLSFNKPLFKGILKSNTMYDLMDNDVIGRDILKQLYWKFSLDDDKMILFSNKDSLLLCKETGNYVKIKNGLIRNNNPVFLPDISNQDNFMFDLGYAGEIMVNNKIFTRLSKEFSPKRFLSVRRTSTKIDTTYVFDGMKIEWKGIKIPNCQIIYRPITNRNLIGVELANRFNFVLAYNEKKNNRIEDNLYLQPRANFQNIKSIPYCSDFGFDIGDLKDGFIIKRIELGGLADKAGISLKDKIISINHGNFNLNDAKRLDFYLKDKKSVNVEIEKDGKIIGKELIINFDD